jgi:hypothetical protein
MDSNALDVAQREPLHAAGDDELQQSRQKVIWNARRARLQAEVATEQTALHRLQPQLKASLALDQHHMRSRKIASGLLHEASTEVDGM